MLLEFAGQVAVYGDVNRKLQSCMVKMKEFIETADMAELEQTRQENEQEIRANFALQQEQKQEALLKQREQNAAIWAAAAARANAGASAEADAEAGGEAVKEEEASVTENEVNEGGKRRKRAKAGAQVNNPAARRRGKEVEDG